MLEPGELAPPFVLPDADENPWSLEEARGRKVLIYFYPRAHTPGCTRQACQVRDHYPELKELGVEVVGISPDAPSTLRKFREKHGLNFPLLSDPELEVARKYGAVGEKKLFGKTRLGILRSAFVVDEKGELLGVYYRIRPEETIPWARKILERG